MQSCSPLVSLPLLPLSAVVQCLGKEDKCSLAIVCRSLAQGVSDVSNQNTVVITPATGWEGLCKVLDTCTIACDEMLVTGTATTHKHSPLVCCFWRKKHGNTAKNALDDLLKPTRDPGHSLPGIWKLHINVCPLPCLLPVGLASLLPDLEELKISCGPGQYAAGADLQPLSYCSSLHKLAIEWDGAQIQLPTKYHTVNDLKKQLPNIVSLELRALSTDAIEDVKGPKVSTSTLLKAWGGQLTELLLYSDVGLAQIERCTRLQSLHHPVNSLRPFPTFLPQSLTSLHLFGSISEFNLQSVLQLPSLCVFSFNEFVGSLQQDWSQHPCTWQQLEIVTLSMADLSKLPLHSLRGEKCLEVSYLVLPDPLLPDSLSKVEHAANCVSSANITIEGISGWTCNDEAWKINEDLGDDAENIQSHELLRAETDTSLAKVFRAAYRVVQPCDSYLFETCPVYPETTALLLGWLSHTLIKLELFQDAEVQPWFWQALQCCSKLTKIVVVELMVVDSGLLENVSSLAVQVSEHLVAVTSRPIMLAILPNFDVLCDKNDSTTTELKMKLQEQLPKSVIISNFDLDCGEFIISLQPAGCDNISTSSAQLPDRIDGIPGSNTRNQ